MYELLQNQEVQTALICLLVVGISLLSALGGLLVVYFKIQKDKLETSGKIDASNIETNTQNIANQVEATRLNLEELHRTQMALEEAKKITDELVKQNRALEKEQTQYSAKQDQLTDLLMKTMRSEAEKAARISELEKQKDVQAELITRLQTQMTEMSAALGMKDEALRRVEDEKAEALRKADALQQRITDLERAQNLDREQIALLQSKIETQQLEIEELKTHNRTMSASNTTQTIPAVTPVVNVKSNAIR